MKMMMLVVAQSEGGENIYLEIGRRQHKVFTDVGGISDSNFSVIRIGDIFAK